MNSQTEIIPALNSDEAELDRQLTICNACRYCESYCAAFTAMTRRLTFDRADMHYLANLCHNCGACLHACQYAEPHDFAVNIPRAMAQVRLHTYANHAWPRALGALYRRNGTALAVAISAALTLFLALALALQGTLWQRVEGGDFYAIFPHNMLVAMFGSVFGYAALAIGLGVRHFWRSVTPLAADSNPRGGAVLAATRDALTLKNLDGGHGAGCNEEDDAFTLARRRFHHLTFYGFLLCLASTSVATLYHYLLGLPAPYPFFSIPVLLGTLGGVGLLAGPAVLFYLHIRRHSAHGDPQQKPMDRGFILLLFAISLSGLSLLAFRATAAMPLLLALHLGVVMAFFLLMPYCKFVHGFYRIAALLKSARESRAD